MDDLFRRKESPLLCSLDNFKALEGAVFVETTLYKTGKI
jgi:hypothetical protein